MANTTLRPNATLANTNFTAVGAATHHEATDDDPDSASNTDYAEATAFTADLALGCTNTPSDFTGANTGGGSGVVFGYRIEVSGWVNDTFALTAWIQDSSNNIMTNVLNLVINNNAAVFTSSNNMTLTAYALANNTKAKWDDCTIVFRAERTSSMGADSITVRIHAAEVNLNNYQSSATATPGVISRAFTLPAPHARDASTARPDPFQVTAYPQLAVPYFFDPTFHPAINDTLQGATSGDTSAYQAIAKRPTAIDSSGGTITFGGGATTILDALTIDGGYFTMAHGSQVIFDVPVSDFVADADTPWFMDAYIYINYKYNGTGGYTNPVVRQISFLGFPEASSSANSQWAFDSVNTTQRWVRYEQDFFLQTSTTYDLTALTDPRIHINFESTITSDTVDVYDVRIVIYFGKFGSLRYQLCNATEPTGNESTFPTDLTVGNSGTSINNYDNATFPMLDSANLEFSNNSNMSIQNAVTAGFGLKLAPYDDNGTGLPPDLTNMTWSISMKAIQTGWSHSNLGGRCKILKRDGTVLAAGDSSGGFSISDNTVPTFDYQVYYTWTGTFNWVNPNATLADWQEALIMLIGFSATPTYGVYIYQPRLNYRITPTNHALKTLGAAISAVATLPQTGISQGGDNFADPNVISTAMALNAVTTFVQHGPSFGPGTTTELHPDRAKRGHWNLRTYDPTAATNTGSTAVSFTGASLQASIIAGDAHYAYWQNMVTGTANIYKFQADFGNGPRNHTTTGNYQVRGVCFLVEIEATNMAFGDVVNAVGTWTDVSGTTSTRQSFSAVSIPVAGNSPYVLKFMKDDWKPDGAGFSTDFPATTCRFDLEIEVTSARSDIGIRVTGIKMVVAYSQVRENLSVFGRPDDYAGTIASLYTGPFGYEVLHPYEPYTVTTHTIPYPVAFDTVPPLNNASDTDFLYISLPDSSVNGGNRLFGFDFYPEFDMDYSVVLTAIRVHNRRRANASNSMTYWFGAVWSGVDQTSVVIAAADSSGNINALDTVTNAGTYMTTSFATYEVAMAYINTGLSQANSQKWTLACSIYNFSSTLRYLHIAELWIEIDWTSTARGLVSTTILTRAILPQVAIDLGSGDATTNPDVIDVQGDPQEPTVWTQGPSYFQSVLGATWSVATQSTFIAVQGFSGSAQNGSGGGMRAYYTPSVGVQDLYPSTDYGDVEDISSTGWWSEYDYGAWNDYDVPDVSLVDNIARMSQWMHALGQRMCVVGYNNDASFFRATFTNGAETDSAEVPDSVLNSDPGTYGYSYTPNWGVVLLFVDINDGNTLATQSDNMTVRTEHFANGGNDGAVIRLSFHGFSRILKHNNIPMQFYPSASYVLPTGTSAHLNLTALGVDFNWGSLTLGNTTVGVRPAGGNSFAISANSVKEAGVRLARPSVTPPDGVNWIRLTIQHEILSTDADGTQLTEFQFRILADDGTVLAAADAGGTPVSVSRSGVTATGVIYEHVVQFPYVNTSEAESDEWWNSVNTGTNEQRHLIIGLKAKAGGAVTTAHNIVFRGLRVDIAYYAPNQLVPAGVINTVATLPSATAFGSGGEQVNPAVISATMYPQPVTAGAGAIKTTTPIMVYGTIPVFNVGASGYTTVACIDTFATPLAVNVTVQQDGMRFGWLLEPFISMPAPTVALGQTPTAAPIPVPASMGTVIARADSTRSPNTVNLFVDMDDATFTLGYTAKPTSIGAYITTPQALGTAGATSTAGAISALVAMAGPAAHAHATRSPLTALTTFVLPPVAATGSKSATAALSALQALLALPPATATAGVSKIIRPATALLIAQLAAVNSGGGTTKGVAVIVTNVTVFSPQLFIAVTRDPSTIVGVFTLGTPTPSAHASRIPGVIDTDIVMPPTHQVDNVTGTRVPDAIQATATPRQTTQGDSISGQRNPFAIPAVLTPLQVIPNQGAGKTAPYVSLSTLMFTPGTQNNVTATPQPSVIDLEAFLGAPVISYGSSRVAQAIQTYIDVNDADLSYGASREPGQVTITVSMGAVTTIAGTGAVIEPTVVLGQFNLNAANIYYGETRLVQRIATQVLMDAVTTHGGGGRLTSPVQATLTPLQVSVFYIPNVDATVSVATIQATVAVYIGDVLVFVDATIEWIVTGQDGKDWEGGMDSFTGYDSMNSMGGQPTFVGGNPGSFEGTS